MVSVGGLVGSVGLAATACSGDVQGTDVPDAASVDAGFPESGIDATHEASEPIDAVAPGTLRGWQLTPTNTGLAAVGLGCATLALYTGPDKPPAGTIITERRIETGLDLSFGNVTIVRSCIRPTSITRGISVLNTTDFNACTANGCAVTPTGVVIRDSEIDGSAVGQEDIAYSCAFAGVGTLERNYIHDVGSGICFFNTGTQLDATADGNYVRGLRAFGDAGGTGSHNESFTVRDFDTTKNPSRRARVRNNRLDCQSGNDSGAFFIQTYAGDIDQLLVQGNLLEGNGYQLVLEAGNGNVYGLNLSAIDNRFSGTGYGPGYVDRKGLTYGWSTWQENYLNDPSRTDNKGKLVPAL